MPRRQQRLIDCYDGDIKKAAKKAKISYDYARRLVTKSHIFQAIKNSQETEFRPKDIADRQERQALSGHLYLPDYRTASFIAPNKPQGTHNLYLSAVLTGILTRFYARARDIASELWIAREILSQKPEKQPRNTTGAFAPWTGKMKSAEDESQVTENEELTQTKDTDL